MIDQTPLTKRHGLALSTFALWQVNISHTGRERHAGFILIFIDLLLIYLEEHTRAASLCQTAHARQVSTSCIL